MTLLLDSLGWLGSGLYIVAHAWITVLKRPAAKAYYWMNVAAALALVVSSALLASWQPVFINGFWALISLAALGGVTLPRLPLTNRWLAAIVISLFLSGAACVLLGLTFGWSLLAWSSVVAFCLSYWRFSAKRLSQAQYFMFSAYAAFILLPQLYFDQNWPVFALEVVWGSLSVMGLWQARHAIK